MAPEVSPDYGPDVVTADMRAALAVAQVSKFDCRYVSSEVRV